MAPFGRSKAACRRVAVAVADNPTPTMPGAVELIWRGGKQDTPTSFAIASGCFTWLLQQSVQ